MYKFRTKQNRFQSETGFSIKIPLLLALLSLTGLLVSPPIPAAASVFRQDGGEIVVVIDPGHGGSNEGTTENGFCEKEMTLVTALALYERLSQYEGVTAYLTRVDDTKLSLAQRAAFAKAVEADFLFSIHYNASENHELFGAEVWVPLEAPYNVYGYQFGCTLLPALREKGLFIRGVKTRRNDKGTDYYGIIRESAALDIPAVIIEHCHVDEPRDYPYCDSPEKQQDFGCEDADAIARFLGLSSASLGIDNSGGPEDPFLQGVYALDTGRAAVSIDTTAPEICSVERVSEDYEGLRATIQVTAADYDSPLMYYDYSLDGGTTYSPRQPWPGCDTLTGEYQDVFQVTLDIPEGVIPSVRVRAYNQYEATAESNILDGYGVFRRPRATAPPGEPESAPTWGAAVNPDSNDPSAGSHGWLGAHEETAPEEEDEKPLRMQDFLLVSLLAAAILVALALVVQILQSAGKRRKRYKRKK